MKVNTADHSDEKSGGGKVVGAGEYELQVLSSTAGVVQGENSKNFGEPKLDLKLAVRDEDNEDNDGHKVFDNITMVESQGFKLKQFLRALGYGADEVNLVVGEDDEEVDGITNLYPEDFEGETIRAKLKVQPASRQYAKKNQVDRYLPAED